jgi:hypothetical protein
VRLATLSNDEGYYTVASLSSARYQVSAEMEGFQRSSSAVEVDAGAVARLDLVLVPARPSR